MDQNKFRKELEKAKRKDERFQSKKTNPRNHGYTRGILNPNKRYTMHILRRVAERAWLINAVIGHIIDKVTPYMRPQAANSTRFFAIELKDTDAKMNDKDKKRVKEIQEFFLKTGWDSSLEHEDDLIHYNKKVLRDVLTIDQLASEQLWSRGNDLLSFEAVDAATILRCDEEGYDGEERIRYVQMIENEVVSQYQFRQMLLEYQNPRTDIDHSGYGYSKIEQCTNLVIALINSFAHNSGAFTEDKLPRGFLLLNGDIGFDELEELEDYIVDVMSPDNFGNAMNKWGVPIIPTGKAGDKASITWQALGNSNRDMEYSRWQDTLYMAIAAVYGIDIESMGIKSEKGAKIMDSGSAEAKKYSDDKGIGNMLTFLERHYQHILDAIDDKFAFRFHGFEQNDAKELREARKSELETFKSTNDMLVENDKEPLDLEKFPWAEVPGLQSPQILQAYQATQNQGEEGDPGDEQGADQEKEDPWGNDEWNKSIDDTVRIVV